MQDWKKIALLWLTGLAAHSLALALVPPSIGTFTWYYSRGAQLSMFTSPEGMGALIVLKGLGSGTIPGLIFGLGLPTNKWRHITLYAMLTITLGVGAVLSNTSEWQYGLLALVSAQVLASVYAYFVGGLVGQMIYRRLHET